MKYLDFSGLSRIYITSKEGFKRKKIYGFNDRQLRQFHL